MDKYLYNGVELPELPGVYDQRPYKYIVQTTSGDYILYESHIEKTVSVKDDIHGYMSVFPMAGKMYIAEGGEWIKGTGGTGCVVSSNTDVYYKIDDTLGELSGTLYLSASETIATANGANYNGIELPKLPYITYPFEMIDQSSSGEYHFFRSASAMYYGSNGVYYCYLIDEPLQAFNLIDGKWVYAHDSIVWTSNVVWSNHDIYSTEGDNAGALMFAASDPVPVGGDPEEPETSVPTPQDFYIVKNGAGQKQDVYLRVGGKSVKLDEYVT